jgi:hypothetical protein
MYFARQRVRPVRALQGQAPQAQAQKQVEQQRLALVGEQSHSASEWLPPWQQ